MSTSEARSTAPGKPAACADKLDEERLRAAATRCLDQVVRYAGRNGFTHSDFITRVPEYKRLELAEQFRVLVMVAKFRDLSSMLGTRGAWHFYARSLAPPGAFNFDRDRPRTNTDPKGGE